MNNQCNESNVNEFIKIHVKLNDVHNTDQSDPNNPVDKPIIKIKKVKHLNYFGQYRKETNYSIFKTKIPHGFGFIQYKTHHQYGYFVDSLPSGEGLYYYYDGKSIYGNWNNDIPNGEVIVRKHLDNNDRKI